MRINGLKKLYLAVGIAGASVFVNGLTVHAQTTESSAEDVVKIKSSLEEMSVAKDYDFMLQLSEPQTLNTKSNTAAIVAQLDGNTLPSQTTPTTPNTLPSDNIQPTTPNTLPSDNIQPTTPNTLPNDNTQPTTPETTPYNNIQPTTPETAPYNNTQPTIPSDGSDPSLRDTQPTIPSDGNTPSDGSDSGIDVDPGRATRSGSSYIGVGGNIGFGGDTGIGEGSFSAISKIGLTRNLSARPAVFFGDNVSILLPLTVDFTPTDLEITRLNVAPYIGGGVVISTGEDDSDVSPLITGGVDVPITTQLTATAGLNVGFAEDVDVGLVVGVGYNFSGL